MEVVDRKAWLNQAPSETLFKAEELAKKLEEDIRRHCRRVSEVFDERVQELGLSSQQSQLKDIHALLSQHWAYGGRLPKLKETIPLSSVYALMETLHQVWDKRHATQPYTDTKARLLGFEDIDEETRYVVPISLLVDLIDEEGKAWDQLQIDFEDLCETVQSKDKRNKMFSRI